MRWNKLFLKSENNTIILDENIEIIQDPISGIFFTNLQSYSENNLLFEEF